MRRRLGPSLLVVLALASACVRGEAPATSEPTSAPASGAAVVPPGLTGDVRYLFEAHCGSCHLPAAMDEHAPRSALTVFNLDDEVFTRGLSDARLVEARRRFAEQNLGAEAMATIDRWLTLEWQHRDGHPEDYPAAFRRQPADDPVVTPQEGCLGSSCMPARAP